MKLKIYPNKDKMYFSTLNSVESFMSHIISRKGYSVTERFIEGKKIFGVRDLQEVDQEIIVNLLIAECESIGLDYKICK